MDEYDLDGSLDFSEMDEYDLDGSLNFSDMDEFDEENSLEPTGESGNSPEPVKGEGANGDSNPSSESSEQEKESLENFSSESTSTVLVSEKVEQEVESPQSNDQDSEEIDQEELEREIEKELEEGVEAINKYLEEEAVFINAYEEMMGAYEAEKLYESMKEEEANNNEEIAEKNEELENEQEVKQGEEVSEPQLSEVITGEEISEQEDIEEELEEGLEEVEQHQVEPLIEETLETEPEPIVNEEEIERLQEMELKEQFEDVYLNEQIEDIIEGQEEEIEQEHEEKVEVQTDKEINYDLEEELGLDLIEQHQVESFIEEVVETEPVNEHNEEKIDQLQDLELEEQFETVRNDEYTEELVGSLEEHNDENDNDLQENEEIEQTQEKKELNHLQEKLDEQEWNLERDYEEKEEVEQHQVETAIEEELETEPEQIVEEEKLEHIKNLEPEKQLEAELFYEFVEELAEKQNGEKEEHEEKEERKELTKEEEIAQIMSELEITQGINSTETEVETESQEVEFKQEISLQDEEVDGQSEIEGVKDHQQELEEILEQNRKLEQEALAEIELDEQKSEKTAKENYERAKKLYAQQTGKRPIYAGKETKGFQEWLEQQKESEEKQKKEEKREPKKEEAWKWSLKNWIVRATEIDPKLKSELLKLVEEYGELDKLIKKYSQLYNKAQREKLSQIEKSELKSLIEALQKVTPINIELFLGIREMKRYLKKQYYYDFWDKPYVNRIRHHFFTLLSQRYKNLNQAQKKVKIAEILKKWIGESTEEGISLEMKAKLLQIIENYDKLEDLATKFMKLRKKSISGNLSNPEQAKFKALIKILKEIGPLTIKLFTNVRAIKRYINDQYPHFLSEKTGINQIIYQFLANLTQKHEYMTQRILIDRSEVKIIYNNLKNDGIPIERIEKILKEHKELEKIFIDKLNTILQEVENIKIISQKQIGDLIGCRFDWIMRKEASISKRTLKRLELLAREKINSEEKIWRNEERRLVNPEEIKKVYFKLKNIGITRSRIRKIIEENRDSDREFSIKLEQLASKKFASRKEIGELLGIDFGKILYPEKNNTTTLKTLRKLELLLNREIPHKVMVGQHEKLYIKETEDLVELTGIILGDGSIYSSKGKYSLRIALNNKHEIEYVEYVKSLMLKVFNVEPMIQPEKGATVLSIWRKSVVNFLISKGFKVGDKVKNQVNVPIFAKKTQLFVIRCLKGLVDTDGWIGVDKAYKKIGIKFYSSSLPLITNFKEFCNSLGIHTGNISPSERYSKKKKKMIPEFSLGIHSKQHVKKFIETIKPMKWKYRYNIIGLTLIALKNSAKWKRIKERLKVKYPDGKSRWNIEYENYLKKLCEEEGYKTNSKTIKGAIDEAFEYKRRRS